MSQPDIAARFAAAQVIAKEAGDLAQSYFRNIEALVVVDKGPQDMASDADNQVEILIRDRLVDLFPGDGFIGEEYGGIEGTSGGTWVVDPIDGTANFVNGIPCWCISIAFLTKDAIEIGIVYDPNVNELFAARNGHGATLNGMPIKASQATSLKDGSVGIGYSTRIIPALAIKSIDRLLAEGGMFIRNGSGALMITYVAAGRLIGYYEPHINSWDCLAAIVLVTEAGGWANDFLADDGLRKGNEIAVSGPHLAADVRRIADMTQDPPL